MNQALWIIDIVSAIIVILIVLIFSYIIINNIKKEEKLYNLAYIDKITKLGNYNYFIEEGNKLLNKTTEKIYVIALDIDKFKSFNKRYGHKTGSELLFEIGKILNKELGKETK